VGRLSLKAVPERRNGSWIATLLPRPPEAELARKRPEEARLPKEH
jgi:hypothetical protein